VALFQKNPYDTREHHSLYSVGLNKTILVIGLGNPGKKYDMTRHNVGFASLDAFATAWEFEPWTEKKDLKAIITSRTLGEARVILCKPTTYMNNSGEAAKLVASFYKIPLDQTIAVYDELDVPFGQIRLRHGGSSAGHNGVKSLIETLGKDFGRVRIGIKSKDQGKMESADFVLAKFSKDEQKQMTPLVKEVNSILTEYVYGGNLPTETRSFLI
jgi:peptidyl-tRNA hydrolase, PTH1 family